MSRIDWKRFVPSRSQWISAGIIMTAGAVAYGVPHVFTAGTTVSADQMNQNFANLEARVTMLEAKLASVSAETVNGHATVRFSGVNVQVVNGLNDSDTANGVGNLILGYDEPRPVFYVSVCSDGTYLTKADCETAGNVWDSSHKSGSHYLVAGKANSYSQYGGVVVGTGNVGNAPNGSAVGGISSVASGLGSVAMGGDSALATGKYAVAIGGLQNKATGWAAVVSGGQYGTASGSYSVVSGGATNSATKSVASVFGGASNVASGGAATVTGGAANTASGGYATVSGGSSRTAAGDYDWVAGGLWQDY